MSNAMSRCSQILASHSGFGYKWGDPERERQTVATSAEPAGVILIADGDAPAGKLGAREFERARFRTSQRRPAVALAYREDLVPV